MNFFSSVKDITVNKVGSHLGGYIYIIKDKNRIKIGTSINPKLRIRCIETSAGVISERIFITDRIYNTSKIETKALKYTRKKDSVGEWRNFCFDKAVEYIMSLNLEYSSIEKDKEKEIKYKQSLEIIKNIVPKICINIENEEINIDNHCSYCMTPVKYFEKIKIKDFDGDFCRLYSEFLVCLYELEEKHKKYNYDILLEYFKNKKIADVVNIESTLTQLIKLSDDIIEAHGYIFKLNV